MTAAIPECEARRAPGTPEHPIPGGSGARHRLRRSEPDGAPCSIHRG